MISRLVDELPARVTATLAGDREALIGLLQIAAAVSWQSRAEILGTVEEVAESAHQFADSVADCYSADRPPPDRLCDVGFELADRVDALAIEVLHRRARDDVSDDSALPPTSPSPGREARHLARAHVAALQEAVLRRPVSDLDVEAAEELYRAIVSLGRQHNRRDVEASLHVPQPPRE